MSRLGFVGLGAGLGLVLWFNASFQLSVWKKRWLIHRS